MDTINIVAVGASGIGKSSLLQRLFGLPPLPGRNIVNGAYSVDNVPYFVTVIEIDLEDFPIDAGQQPFQWPKQIDGYVIPRVDGALVMYDVSNKESTANLAAAISKWNK